MEPKDGAAAAAVGFNRKRAEGRDKPGQPKVLQRKVRRVNPVSTICYVQILGTGMDTQDTLPSVLLFFDRQRFIFNAGEGLQRFCTEHKIKLSKIDHMFLTRVCSETAGGLPGLLLTLAGIGEEGMSVNVWGPSDLKYLVDAMRSFIPNAAMVHTHSFGLMQGSEGAELSRSKPDNFTDPIILIDDEVIRLSAIMMKPSYSHLCGGTISDCNKSDLTSLSGEENTSQFPVSTDVFLQNKTESTLKPGDIAVIYVCELPEIRGTFDPKEAAKHGLRPGPKYRELQLGNSVMSDDLSKMFHLRPKALLGLDRSLIPSFSNHKDIVTELLLEILEVADVSKHLNGIWQSSLESGLIHTKEENVVMVEEPWLNGTACGPSDNLARSEADACKEDTSGLNGIWKKGVIHECNIPPCLENITREDMEVVLLGTGSSQPSKYRNVSSLFINLFSKGSLLLDCGEGTLGQLKRRYGVKGADDAVKRLTCIWISHIHADHHTGLARILALRSQLLKDVPHEPLPVVGPRQLKRFLDAYSRVEDLDMQFLDCSYTTEASLDTLLASPDSSKDSHLEPVDKGNRNVGIETVTSQHLESTVFAQGTRMQSFWKRPRNPVNDSVALSVLVRLKEVLSEAGLEVLCSFPVIHCPQAFGVVLKASDRINIKGKVIPGWKLVYSGDTRPCQSVIDASHDATILIHEATFEDGLEDEAIARNHSTTKEAISVGEAAGVYRIILTHFSQRYPKIPVFDEAHMDRTCVGFDLMSVNLADLPVLPKVLPYLRVLFKNEMVADEVDEFDDVLGAVAHQ